MDDQWMINGNSQILPAFPCNTLEIPDSASISSRIQWFLSCKISPTEGLAFADPDASTLPTGPMGPEARHVGYPSREILQIRNYPLGRTMEIMELSYH